MSDTLDDFGAGVLEDPNQNDDDLTEIGGGEGDPSLVQNPLTGSVVDLNDLDSLILACDDVKQQIADLKAFDRLLRDKAMEYAKNGTGKTRRIQGKKYVAKVELGSVSPVQSILKEVWQVYPDLAASYLRVDSLGVKATEFKKLLGTTTTDPKLNTVRSMLQDAHDKGNVGMATVSMEKPKGEV